MGDGALARSFIRELDSRYPTTVWREERDAMLVLAGCSLDEADASERARAFLRRRDGSLYVERIVSLCRLGDATSGATTSADGSPKPRH
jgi:hypothetical protein